MQDMPTIVIAKVLLKVTNPAQVISGIRGNADAGRLSLNGLKLPEANSESIDTQTLEACLYAMTNNPIKKPEKCGYELLAAHSNVKLITDDQYLLFIATKLHHAGALKKAAHAAFLQCWGGNTFKEHYDKPTLEDYLYEVAVNSNNSLCRDYCGFEIVSPLWCSGRKSFN